MLEIVHSKEMTSLLLEKGTDDICILMILCIDDADDNDVHTKSILSFSAIAKPKSVRRGNALFVLCNMNIPLTNYHGMFR